MVILSSFTNNIIYCEFLLDGIHFGCDIQKEGRKEGRKEEEGKDSGRVSVSVAQPFALYIPETCSCRSCSYRCCSSRSCSYRSCSHISLLDPIPGHSDVMRGGGRHSRRPLFRPSSSSPSQHFPVSFASSLCLWIDFTFFLDNIYLDFVAE